MKKYILRAAIVVVLLAILAVVVVGLTLDGTVKKTIERVGPEITQVPVTIEGLKVSLFSGHGSLRGFVVGNPKGYESPFAIQIGGASLSVRPFSIFSDKIVVRHVRIENPEITFEGGLKGNNLKTILANIEESAQKEKKKKRDAGTKDSESEPTKLQLDELSITGAKVNVRLKELGGKVTTLTLPDIMIKDLGQGPEGVTPSEIGEELFRALLEKSIASVGGSLGDIGKDAIDAATRTGAKQIDQAEKVLKGVNNLFKK